ncbi:alcohol dehydrogenase catalytic domain-containing protein [Brachybacterium sp. GCM10030252]|uniref:alcohol dehydrogenase catalytic domain-containing protein n=1 Tax=Brachybacterium sp. GCM10030252 TaxID=3273380 RepID=UPI00366F9A94
MRRIAEPHVERGEIRIRVRAAGLNPLDWQIAAMPSLAAHFGLGVRAGFGSDLAGVVDEVGPGAEHAGFHVGDRVYGGIMGQAVADVVVVPVPVAAPNLLRRVPDGVADATAAALPTPGLTAVAAVDAVGPGAADTILLGGAAGGVGVLAVQLARLAGATVIGSASEATFPFLRRLGALPVAYGPGLPDRVRRLARRGVTAAIDLHGIEAAEAGLELGVDPRRIATVAAGAQLPGVRSTGAHAAARDALQRIEAAILAGRMTVPIAERFPVERIRDAVAVQAAGHVHGKILITFP